MKMKRVATTLAAFTSLAVLLGGCGSNINSDSGTNGTDPTRPIENAATVGIAVCAQCHADINARFKLSGKVNQSAHVQNSAECVVCHDPNGDSADLYAAYGTNGTAVGCEACHGGGQYHNGIGPLPNPKPGIDTCLNCHDEPGPGHLPYHPEGNVNADYQTSAHAKLAETEWESEIPAKCSMCHTNDGAQKYKDVEGTRTAISGTYGYFASTGPGSDDPAIANPAPVICQTCHNPHGGLLKDATATTSAEYNTCTHCHAVGDAYHGEQSSYSWTAGEGTNQYTFSGEEIIYDTHGQTGIMSGSKTSIRGYAIRGNNDRACRDCHNVHSAADENLATNKEWAKSGHASFLLEVKEAAAETVVNVASPWTAGTVPPVVAAGAANTSPNGYYNWDATLKADGTSDRGQCQECHTSTGFVNFLKDGLSYNYKNNDFSHLPGWAPASTGVATTASSQNEMIFCWACHTNSVGALRTTGPVTLTEYTDSTGNTLVGTSVMPDIKHSNICVKCHGGRNNADAYGVANDLRSTRFPGHHAATAASIFNTIVHIAYEFPGKSYAASVYSHDNAGLNGSDTRGPCVACHMSGGEKHTFEPLDDAAHVITAQAATCDQCHVADTFFAMDYDILMGIKADYNAALAVLAASLTSAGYNPASSADAATLALFQAGAPLNAYGAYHNYKYLAAEEKAAYVHNGQYARSLIFDSLDYLDNGTLGGTITLNPATQAAAIRYFNGNADTGVVIRPAI